jgi:hypothetical protein
MDEARKREAERTAEIVALCERLGEESRAFSRELRERLDRLPPPAQAA